MKKIGISWKVFVAFLVITCGLLYITQSFFMSLGIVLLLFVIEHFFVEFFSKKKNDKDDDHGKKS